jgi:AraC-like DNA-binding protein
MNKRNFLDYENAFKNYILGIIYILTGLYLLNFIYFYFASVMLGMRYFLLAFFVLNGLFTIITHIIPYSYLIKLMKPIIAVMFLLYYPMVIWHLSVGVVASLLWFIVIPLFIYVVLPDTKIVRWLIWCGSLMLLAIGLGYALWYFMYSNNIIPKTSYAYQMRVIIPNLLNTIAAFLFASYSLIYINRFSKLRISSMENAEKPQNLHKTHYQEQYKFEKIYEKIVLYIESIHPYLNSNFKIGELSGKLDVNTAYIDKAILLCKNTNFNNFINLYRVAHAKKLIQENLQYTLEYIYCSSGFKNQSSFNRIFKVLEGMTPSEYRISLLRQSQSRK